MQHDLLGLRPAELLFFGHSKSDIPLMQDSCGSLVDASPFDICGHRVVDVRTAHRSWKDFQPLLRLPERRSADKMGVT